MCGYINARRRPGIFSLLLIAVLLTGCATPQTRQLLASSTPLPRTVELTEIPFFPQEEYQCGPAALATVLNNAGVNITPDELTPQVYLPKRQGSLQFELLAATRRHGRIPYVLKPQLEAVMSEVAAGNPVLVLQNLGLDAIPVWHYAVVVGFDLDQANVVLRSGVEPRHITSLQTFEHTWSRGDDWAVVVMPPDKLPQTAEELPYLNAVLTLEKLQQWQEAATAYTTALTRWPQNLGAQMGLGNSRYALNDLHSAEEAFRNATQRHPEAAVAFNNLAQVLADQQRWDEAKEAAQQAMAIGGDNAALFQQTLEEIRTHTQTP
jgi:hypothetical protein